MQKTGYVSTVVSPRWWELVFYTALLATLILDPIEAVLPRLTKSRFAPAGSQ